MASQSDGKNNGGNRGNFPSVDLNSESDSCQQPTGIVNEGANLSEGGHGRDEHPTQHRVSELREGWEAFANKHSQEMYQRCPGSTGSYSDSGTNRQESSSAGSSHHSENRGQQNIQSTVRFHLYVAGDADDVTLMFEKPIGGHDLTVKLQHHNRNHWFSPDIPVPASSDDIRYKYTVKFEKNFLKKMFSALFTSSENSPVNEVKYRTLKLGPMDQYDIFKLPKDDQPNRRLYAGHFYFVAMIYNDHNGGYRSLKDALMECENVGFGNQSYAKDDKTEFCQWISCKVSTGVTPEQSAFICCLIAQLAQRAGSTFKLSRSIDAETVSGLLLKLKNLPKERLPSSSLRLIQELAQNLVESSTFQCGCLQYITYFCNLFDVGDLLQKAQNLIVPHDEEQFDKLVGGAVESVGRSSNCAQLFAFIVSKAPTVKCLWKLYYWIESTQPSLRDSLKSAFADAFCQMVSLSVRPGSQDLLEKDLWSRSPPVLREHLVGPFCKALIKQIGREASWTDDRQKALLDVLLDERICTSEHGIQLILYISTSKHLALQLTHFMNKEEAKPFWQNLDNERRQKLCITLLTSISQLLALSNSIRKGGLSEKVISGLSALEQICETRLLYRDKELCAALGRHLLYLLEHVDLDTLLEVHQQNASSLSLFAKEWLLALLKAAVQKWIQVGTAQGRSRMKRLLQTLKGDSRKPAEKSCTKSAVIKQEILETLLCNAELPGNTGKVDAEERILKALIKNEDLWSLALAIDGTFTSIPNLQSARDVLKWFKDAVSKHELRVGFVHSLTDKNISLLSNLCMVTSVGQGDGGAHNWKTMILSEREKASNFKQMFGKLKSVMSFVQKAGESIVEVEDWKIIISEVNKGDKQADEVLVSDTEGDGYWGTLLGLVDHADAIDELRTSTMFLNVARACLTRNHQQDDQLSRTTEDLIVFLVNEGVESFQKACKPLFNRQTDHCLEDLHILMDGIETKEHLDKELKFLCSYFNRRSVPCREKLLDYLKYPSVREKAEKLFEVLMVVGYDCSKEDLLTNKSMDFPSNEKEWKLSHLSEKVSSLSKVDEIVHKELRDVATSLGEASELVAFVKEIADEDILVLIDAVEEHSDQYVSESIVADLIDVHRFLCTVLKHKPGDPLQFVQLLRHAFDSLEKTSGMAVKIKNCNCNVHSLRGLYMNVANRGEVTKEIIHNALFRGCYQLGRQTEAGPWNVTLTYEREEGCKTERSYTLSELHDLRSRAHLIVNTDKKQPLKETETSTVANTADLLEFVTQIDLITESLHMCQQLQCSGHPKYKTYWTKLRSSTEKIQGLANSLQAELEIWKSVLGCVRKEFFYLNFFHADQLWHLEKFFTGNITRPDDVSQTWDLLRFIDTSVQFEEIECFRNHFKRPKATENLENDLKFVGEVLASIFKHRKMTQKVGFPKRQLQGTVKPGKVFVAILEPGSTHTVQVVMSIFENTIGCVPQPNEVLFCHRDTSWEEVERLLHRSFEVQSQAPNAQWLHCLANVDSLPNDMQFDLVATIKKLEANTEGPYLLSLVCCGGQHHHIADQFSESVHHIAGMTEVELEKRLANNCPHVAVVTSELPGLGKTETIYEAAAFKERSVVTFPISGPVCRKNLVKRLAALKVMRHDCIHFDIGEVDDPLALDTFLFELVVVGMVSSGTQVFHVPTKYIFIEVANTLKQWLFDALPVTKCFRRLALTWNDYQNLVVSDEVTSPIQVVCHYLHAYKTGTLEKRELVFTGKSILTPLEATRCRDLLSQYFSAGGDLTFNIVECFINVFSHQLLKFSASLFLKPHHLKCMVGPSHDVRTRMFEALLDVSKEFAARSVETCKAVQAKAMTKEQAADELKKIQLDSAKTAMQMVERVEEMIQWADSNHLLICFQSLVPGPALALYRNLNSVPKSIQTLFEGQALNMKKLGDLTAISQEELQSKLDQIVCTSPRQNDIALKSLAYALTLDNVLKMVLIMQRIRARIPVIVMGETGCGKTSLVRYLAKTCEVPFDVFNLHAGVKEETIVSFVLQKDAEARKCGKEIWMFLDEINTSEYLGSINEIMCHRSIKGMPLSSNLVFIAACNPYRLRPSGSITTAGLGGKLTVDESSKLVYRVHPLPETMIDYVWDYGSLSPIDERAYIGRMVESLNRKASKELLINLLASSQDHIRAVNNNPYCVSLRDVHRCIMLIRWFHDTLRKRPKLPLDKVEDHVKKHFEVSRQFKQEHLCIVLALAHCYQSRISTAQARKAYSQKMSDVFRKHHCNVLPEHFEAIVRAEQEEYLARMELPPGTARNAALRENVFVMLVCILNHIPVFVVGKPGCSKSLSMQVIRSNLRGKDMRDPFLKSLPQLYVVSYQGSESSTSEGIEKVFEKARKYKEYKDTNDILPVVLLDEIGLAEISKYNPLKVLHSLLEPEDGKLPDVAVVGISNWALDAAKMNRAIHLSRPEPDVKDLYETGLSIRQAHARTGTTRSGKQFQPLFPDNNQLHCLAKAYHEYQKTQSHANFHGLRDYYSLIKSLSGPSPQSSSLSDAEPDDSRRSHRALLRNFGGLPDGLCNIQRLFVEKLETCSVAQQSHSFMVTDLIRENLHDKHARHLMLITNGDSAIGILDQTLEGLDKEKITIFGSHLEEDLSEDYSYRILSRIILCMERDCVLILRDLDNIYGSLYDMLNQNYTVVGGKKNCRVALGPFSNPICQVHDGFRCIVLVDQQKVDFTDPPFLNRFEKQLLRFSDVLSTEQREIIENLRIWVKDIATIPDVASSFAEKDMFVGFHEDTLPSLVLYNSQDKGIHKEEVLNKCKDDLMWVASPDGVLRSLKSKQASTYVKETRQLYFDYFDKPIHNGLADFLHYSINYKGDDEPKNEEDMVGMKILVMTHSSIHVNVKDCLYGVIKCHTEKLSSFRSEKQLTKQLQQFWDDSEAEVLALQCKPDLDATHMLLAKSIIEQQRGKYFKSVQENTSPLAKHVCIIVHEQRSSQETDDTPHWQFNFLSGWKQVMIDVLEQPILPINSLLNLTVNAVLCTPALSFARVAADQLLWCFTRIKHPAAQESHVDAILQLESRLRGLPKIMEAFKNQVNHWIAKKEEEEVPDPVLESFGPTAWQVSVACDKQMLVNSSTLVGAMQQYVSHLVRQPLAKIIYFLERESAWVDSIRGDGPVNDDEIQLWVDMLSVEDIFNMNDIPEPQGAESYFVPSQRLALQFPFASVLFKRIESVKDFFLEELRGKQIDGDSPDEDRELPLSSIQSLQQRFTEVVGDRIPEIFVADALKHKSATYLEDVLDIRSAEFSSSLSRDKRVALLKAACAEHIKIPEQSDTDNKVILLLVMLHSVFWMNDAALMSTIRLYAASQAVSISLDQFGSELVASFDQNIIAFLQPVPIDDKESDVEHSVTAIEEKATQVMGFKGFHGDGFSRKNGAENKSREKISIGGSISDKLVPEDLEDSDDVLDEEPGDEKPGKEPPSIQADEVPVDSSGESSDYDRTSETTEPEQVEKLSFQEALVEAICVAVFPKQSVVNNHGGVSGWSQKVSFLMSIMSRMNSNVPAFHYLRVCHDLATVVILPGSLEPYSLFALGELGNSSMDDGMYLDSQKRFKHIHELVEGLRTDAMDNDRLQEFCVHFYGRCIDSNPDTPVLGSILENICATTNATVLKFASPVIHRLLWLEEHMCPGAFEAVLKSSDALEDHPGLNDISMALSKVSEENTEMELEFPVAVVCCDLIGEVAFQGINLTTIVGSDDSSLVNLRVAAKILTGSEEEEDVFRFLCAVAYLRSFLSAVAKLIQTKQNCLLQDGEFSMLLNDVNAVISSSESGPVESRKSAILTFLLKELRKELPIHDLRDLCKRSTKLFALKTIQWQEQDSFGKLGFDPLKELRQESRAQEALANLMVKKEDQQLRDFMKTLDKSDISRRDLAAVLLESFYFIRSVRNLKSAEQEVADYIEKWIEAEKLPKHFTALVMCIIGKKEFQDQDLNISPESSARHVQQAALVLHLGAILASLPFYGKSPGPPFPSYFVNPPTNGSIVLAAPGDSNTGYQTFCHYPTKESAEACVFLCPCGVAFADASKRKKICPVHLDNAKGTTSQTHLVQEVTRGTKVPIPQGIKEKQETFLCVRGLAPVEFRMLHLLVHTAAYAGHALGLSEDSGLRNFLLHSEPQQEVSKACFHLMMKDVHVLKTLLDVGEEEVLQLMHCAINKATLLFAENTMLTSEASRTSWENRFVNIMAPLLHGKETNKWKSNSGEALEVSSPSVEQQVNEKHIPSFKDVQSRNLHIPRLFRAAQLKTFNNFRAFCLNANDQVKKNHPLLGLFLDHLHTLPLITHLSKLLHWSRLVDSQLSRRLSRKDAKSLKIGDVIRGTHGSKKTSQKQSWTAAFDNFRRSWEDVRPFVMEACGLVEMPHLSETSSITLCLVDRRDDGIYLCSALEFLQKLQNAFLEKVLAVTAIGKCVALSFLQKMDRVSTIPMVHLQDAREQEIIHYQWSDEILRHSQRDIEYGRGNEIFYDLGKIEKELAIRFLPGKAYLSTQASLRMFVFSKELFHTCSNILNDLQQIIPQTRLSRGIKNGLLRLKERSLESVQELLEHLEIVLCLLKQTGGKPKQPLVDFTDRWLSTSRPFPKGLLPEPRADIQLEHVVSLYECLEDIFAESSAHSVPDIYRKPLLDDVKDQMFKVVTAAGSPGKEADTISLDVIVTALCRFMFRYLSSEDMRPEPGGDSLAESMMEPSIWPMGFFKPETQKQVQQAIPDSLTIGHVHSVFLFYQEHLKELQAKKPVVTQGAAKGRGVQRPAQKRRRTKNFSMI